MSHIGASVTRGSYSSRSCDVGRPGRSRWNKMGPGVDESDRLDGRVKRRPAMGTNEKSRIPTKDEVLPGRETPMPVPELHDVNGHRILPPFPAGLEKALFGMGCFWGAERKFWQTKGVYSTAVGYAGGVTPNPTYREVCSGMTGHAEVVLVVFDPKAVSYEELLRIFWESHDPTQGMRQGNDIGTQYRSAVYAD